MNYCLVKNIYGLTYDHEKIYFVTNVILAILYFDCSDGKVKILSEFPKEVETVCAFEKIVKYGDKIYLFPCLEDYAYCYDLKKEEYQKLDIFGSAIDKIPERKVLETLIYNKKIYCICRCPDMVICIDTETDAIQVYMLSAKLPQRKRTELVSSVIIKDDRLIFPCVNDLLIEFDMNTNVFNIISLNEKMEDIDINDYIMDICMDSDGTLWLCSFKGQLYKVVDNRKIKVDLPENFIKNYDAGVFGIQRGIDRMFAVGDSVYFTLRSECKVLQYNVNNGDFLWINNTLSKWNDDGIRMAFINYTQVDNETFWFYNWNDYAAYRWDFQKGFTKKIEFRISIDELLKVQFAKEYLTKCDEAEVGLEYYISHVKAEKYKQKIKSNINLGKKIYDALI